MPRRLLAIATGSSLVVVATLVTVLGAGSPAYAACTPAQLIANPGFEVGSSPWTATAGVIGSFPSQPPHSGTRDAWLGGDAVKHTDTLSQTVTLPVGCTSATLTYWLHIDTAETTSVARDRLTVKLGNTTIASYSNLDPNTGYQLRTIDVSAFAGQTVVLSYTGVESPNLQTSFVIDDVTLDVVDGASQDPVVTNPGNQSSIVGTPVSLQIVATDPQGDNLSYGATGLPAGLSINSSTGLIAGTPTTPATGNVTVTAMDPGSHSGSAAFTWTVNPTPADPTRTPAQGSYTLNLTSDTTGGTWTGHETISFTNVSPTPLSEVYLRLWDNYHGTCPSNQPIQISGVTGGTAGALEVNCTAVKVTLPAALNQNQSGTIGFDVSIVVPNGSDRFGRDGSYNFIGNAIPVLAVRDGAGWHLDPYTNNGESFYQLASNYTVSLDHPTSVLTPTTGTATDAPGGPGRTVTTATATNVREFAWVAGPFTKSTTTTTGGVVFNTWWTSGITSGTAASMQSTGVAAMDGHAARFGAYPYGEVDLVLHNNFWFGGMEYPGLVLSQTSSVPVIHELGHQWWYGIVGDDEYTSPWLDEGFTDYATDLQRGVLGTNCWAAVSWQSVDEKITNPMAYWDLHSSRYGTVVYTYGKCALHDLRRTIGDSAMANLMLSYAQSHWYGVSTVAEFKAAAQAATPIDLSSFWTTHRVAG
ncbi:MAG: putative Ig domain-containing protein [Micromonosporaceae bacterium]